MATDQKFTYAQLKALFANLNPKRIKTRTQPGSSKEMSYLEAWDIKAALIRVFGPAATSWVITASDIIHTEKVPKSGWVNGKKETLPFPENYNWQVSAKVTGTLTIHQTGAQYSGSAVSSQTGPTFGDVAEFAIKTADSDALKRAAIFLGTQFGLSLYDSGSTQDIVKMSMAEDAFWPQSPPVEKTEVTNAAGETAVSDTTPVDPERQKLVDEAFRMAEERDNSRSDDPVNEETPITEEAPNDNQ